MRTRSKLRHFESSPLHARPTQAPCGPHAGHIMLVNSRSGPRAMHVVGIRHCFVIRDTIVFQVLDLLILPQPEEISEGAPGAELRNRDVDVDTQRAPLSGFAEVLLNLVGGGHGLPDRTPKAMKALCAFLPVRNSGILICCAVVRQRLVCMGHPPRPGLFKNSVEKLEAAQELRVSTTMSHHQAPPNRPVVGQNPIKPRRRRLRSNSAESAPNLAGTGPKAAEVEAEPHLTQLGLTRSASANFALDSARFDQHFGRTRPMMQGSRPTPAQFGPGLGRRPKLGRV